MTDSLNLTYQINYEIRFNLPTREKDFDFFAVDFSRSPLIYRGYFWSIEKSVRNTTCFRITLRAGRLNPTKVTLHYVTESYHTKMMIDSLILTYQINYVVRFMF